MKYFTSRIRKPEDSRLRQGTYLDAIAARADVDIIEGKYDDRPNRCPDCGHRWSKAKEKMTDVQLALALVVDAIDDDYDTAFLLCADADLVPAVTMAQERFARRCSLSPRLVDTRMTWRPRALQPPTATIVAQPESTPRPGGRG